MGDTGFEPASETVEKDGSDAGSPAARSHFVAHGGQIDADLLAVIDTWPELPKVVKSDILALIAAHVKSVDCG